MTASDISVNPVPPVINIRESAVSVIGAFMPYSFPPVLPPDSIPPLSVIAFKNGAKVVAVSGNFKIAPASTLTKLALLSEDKPGTRVPEEIIAVPVKVLDPFKTHAPAPVPFLRTDKVPPLGSGNTEFKDAEYIVDALKDNVGDVPKTTKLPELPKFIPALELSKVAPLAPMVNKRSIVI